jgi:hypothetical protein
MELFVPVVIPPQASMSTKNDEVNELSSGFLESIEPKGLPEDFCRVLVESGTQIVKKVIESDSESSILEVLTYSLSTNAYHEWRVENSLFDAIFKMNFVQGFIVESEAEDKFGDLITISIDSFLYTANLIRDERLNFWILEIDNVPLRHDLGTLVGDVTFQGLNFPLSVEFESTSIEQYLLGSQFFTEI